METPQRNLAGENPNELRKLMDDALQYGSISDLEALFDEGMDINQTDFSDRTALMMCTVQGKTDAVKMLIQRGADINLISMYQGRIPKTALDGARECRKSAIEQILVEHGAKTGAELHQTQE